MELRHLRYFIKSAELLHFTEAAAALKVSQPNLSLQIQQLEDELGARLFERVGRAVHLTMAGELFLDYARQALHELESGQQGIHLLHGLAQGNLRIGVTNSLSAEIVPGMLAEFARAYPSIQVAVVSGSNRYVESAIRNGELNLGLVCLSSKPTDFNSLKLFKEDIQVVVARNHRLARSKSLRIVDLNGVPLALPTPDLSTRQLIDRAFAAAQITPNIIVESNDIDVLMGLAKHGIAATILTSRATAARRLGNISKIRFNEKGLCLTAELIWPRGTNDPITARFIELAGNAFSDASRPPHDR